MSEAKQRAVRSTSASMEMELKERKEKSEMEKKQRNKEKIQERGKIYRYENKEKIKERNQLKAVCEICNCEYTMKHKGAHQRTKKCLDVKIGKKPVLPKLYKGKERFMLKMGGKDVKRIRFVRNEEKAFLKMVDYIEMNFNGKYEKKF